MRSLVPAPASRPACTPRPSPGAVLATALFALAAVASFGTAVAAPLYPLTPAFTGTDAGGNGQYPLPGHRGFTSHGGIMIIESGLPPGSPIVGRMTFHDLNVVTEVPGGPLGGELTDVTGRVTLEMRGLGLFAGYSRTVTIPVTMRFATGPQAPGTSPQLFPVDLDQAFGQMSGDPEFALLRVTAGTSFGLPGPGRAALTLHSSGDWLVDSFFDITYRVDFVGEPGGPFAGMSGSTTSLHRQRAGTTTNADCLLPDNGAGTADWPPYCAGWESETEGLLYEGPPGTFLIGRITRSPAPGGVVLVPGGPFDGEQADEVEQGTVEVVGEGALGGFQRSLPMAFVTAHDLGPGMSLVPNQGRVSDATQVIAEILGDPDFDLLRITAGSGFGLRSPGHTSLLHASGGQWIADGFFDLNYRADVVGAAGGALAGHVGSAIAEARLQAGREREGECTVPDNGSGTADFPPMCATGFASPRRLRGLLDGMPPGSPVLVDIELVPLSLVTVVPGGTLGGNVETWTAKAILRFTGAGVHAGYSRQLSVPANVVTHTGPAGGGATPQHFETDLFELLGQVTIDPDFDLLRIAGGTNFGMPSPGFTSLTATGGGQWKVDSFFDISFRLDFIGAIGGPFAGMSGSTNDRQRFVNGEQPTVDAPPRPLPLAMSVGPAAPNPTRAGVTLALELPRRARVRLAVHDVTGRLVRVVEDGVREAGAFTLGWDGAGGAGERMRPGLYLLRVDADGRRVTRRVVLTR